MKVQWYGWPAGVFSCVCPSVGINVKNIVCCTAVNIFQPATFHLLKWKKWNQASQKLSNVYFGAVNQDYNGVLVNTYNGYSVYAKWHYFVLQEVRCYAVRVAQQPSMQNVSKLIFQKVVSTAMIVAEGANLSMAILSGSN